VHAQRAQHRRLLQPPPQGQQVGAVDVVARFGERRPRRIGGAQRGETRTEPVRDRRWAPQRRRQRGRAEGMVAREVVDEQLLLAAGVGLPLHRSWRLAVRGPQLRRHQEEAVPALERGLRFAHLRERARLRPPGDAAGVDPRDGEVGQRQRVAAQSIRGAAFVVAVGGVEMQRERLALRDRRTVAHVEHVGDGELAFLQRHARPTGVGHRVAEDGPRRTQRRGPRHVDAFPVAVEIGEHGVATVRDDLRHAAHVGGLRIDRDRLAVLARQRQDFVAPPVARAHELRVGEVADQHRPRHRRPRVHPLEQPPQREHRAAVLVRGTFVHVGGEQQHPVALGGDVLGVATQGLLQRRVFAAATPHPALDQHDDDRVGAGPHRGQDLERAHLGAAVAIEIERREAAHDGVDVPLCRTARREHRRHHHAMQEVHAHAFCRSAPRRQHPA
jgi:hypothetical protein